MLCQPLPFSVGVRVSGAAGCASSAPRPCGTQAGSPQAPLLSTCLLHPLLSIIQATAAAHPHTHKAHLVRLLHAGQLHKHRTLEVLGRHVAPHAHAPHLACNRGRKVQLACRQKCGSAAVPDLTARASPGSPSPTKHRVAARLCQSRPNRVHRAGRRKKSKACPF